MKSCCDVLGYFVIFWVMDILVGYPLVCLGICACDLEWYSSLLDVFGLFLYALQLARRACF